MDNLTLAGYFVYLAALSLATHVSGQSWLGFLLAPLPMALVRMDDLRFMLLALSGYLLFFEGGREDSNFLFLNTPDSLILSYAALYWFNRSRFGEIGIPVSPGLTPLYIFIAYGFALSVVPLLETGTEFYLMRDLKNLCFLLLVPMLCRAGNPLLRPKSVFTLLCAIVALSAMHAAVELAGFLADGKRIITWNEVFFADGILIAAILLGLDLSRRTRLFLYTGLTLCLLGVLACQTRGLWISLAASLTVYAFLKFRKSGRFDFGLVRRRLPMLLMLPVAAEILLRISTGGGLEGFLLNRMGAHEANELVNPWSSMGYRIHESLSVWEKRTWFGHGSGAKLHLFFTQLGMSKTIDWWSIHSEYFEILHKYGIVGLGIFLWFLAALAIRAKRLAMRGTGMPSALGFISLVTLINHSVVSITSGFLIRENVMLFMVLIVCMVEFHHPRVEGSPVHHRSAPPAADPIRAA